MSSEMGGMDIRLPMGLMFLIIGAVIGVYGMMTNGDVMYADHSLGININLIWGGVLAAFGIVMLLLTWMGSKSAKNAA